MLGKFTWIFFGTVLVLLAIAVGVVISGGADAQSSSVPIRFYEASAQVLPILMLAQTLRIGWARKGSLLSHARVRTAKAEHEKFVNEIQAKGDPEEPKTKEWLSVIEEKLTPAVEGRVEEVERQTGRSLELLAGSLLLTLFLGLLGLGSAFLVLAFDTPTDLSLLFTSVGLIWSAAGLIFLEWTLFIRPEELSPD